MSTLLHEHISESDFQQTVIDTLILCGWRVHAERSARTLRGWCTPIQGHVGFPDILAAKDGKLWVIELKADKGRVSGEQWIWLERLDNVMGVVAEIIRPRDWPKIEAALLAEREAEWTPPQ